MRAHNKWNACRTQHGAKFMWILSINKYHILFEFGDRVSCLSACLYFSSYLHTSYTVVSVLSFWKLIIFVLSLNSLLSSARRSCAWGILQVSKYYGDSSSRHPQFLQRRVPLSENTYLYICMMMTESTCIIIKQKNKISGAKTNIEISMVYDCMRSSVTICMCTIHFIKFWIMHCCQTFKFSWTVLYNYIYSFSLFSR